LQMRWYVDNQLYYTARSAGGNGNKEAGWYSLGKCSGEACATAPMLPGNAPFDRVGRDGWGAVQCRRVG